jgi:cell division protein FtsB
MLTDINAGLQSVKVLSDLLSANKSLKNYNELAAAVYEVNSKLSAAHDIISKLRERNDFLEKRTAEMEEKLSNKEKFDREIARYALHELKSGMFVNKIKPEHEAIGEPHYICTDCARNGEISFYQPVLNGTKLICDSCKKVVLTGWKPGVHKNPD